MYSIMFYENSNMYTNNINNMPLYNMNVLLGIMKMDTSTCIPMDQNLRCYIIFWEKSSVRASSKTLAFTVITDSLTSESELLCLPADLE